MVQYTWQYSLNDRQFTLTTEHLANDAYTIVGVTGHIGANQITGLGTANNPNNTVYTDRYSAANDGFQRGGVTFTLSDGTQYNLSVVSVINSVPGGGFTVQDQLYETFYNAAGVQTGTAPVDYTYSTDAPTACFVAGTLIAVPHGEVAVEDLAVGDLVSTADGRAAAVRWVGTTTIRPGRRSDAERLLPIRIKAGALSNGVPRRDLRVSPGHAVLVGEVLINAGELVNGATIVQEQADLVHYHHVELDRHDLLVAEGLACESYLDDGNRASFSNGADPVRLHGRIDRAAEETCRPLVTSGPLLASARRHLLARAMEMGWAIGEKPELRVAAGERRIEPVAVAGDRYRFVIPREASGTLRLCSATAMPDRIDPALADNRRLGVAVGELLVDGKPVALASAAFGAGFYPLEDDGHAAWRWMSGNAELALDTQPMMIELRLQIVMPVLHRAPAAERRAA